MASHVSERKRVREVRKYYNRSPDDVPIAGAPLPPGKDGLESTKGMATTAVASPNKTLTALMQLIACRLGMQRAMVSVVDETAQYFLAESTRTLDLVDPLQHEDGDELWMGCGGTARSEALCANTIKLPHQEKSYACFYVCDLPQDSRFSKLPYVAGPPFFRFYAGTPLLTRNNVPIGSVFVIDTRPRSPPTKFEINLLGVMAKNVMGYLEMRRESEMRLRNEVMSHGLASLVDGKFSIYKPQAPERKQQSCCFQAPAVEVKVEGANSSNQKYVPYESKEPNRVSVAELVEEHPSEIIEPPDPSTLEVPALEFVELTSKDEAAEVHIDAKYIKEDPDLSSQASHIVTAKESESRVPISEGEDFFPPVSTEIEIPISPSTEDLASPLHDLSRRSVTAGTITGPENVPAAISPVSVQQTVNKISCAEYSPSADITSVSANDSDITSTTLLKPVNLKTDKEASYMQTKSPSEIVEEIPTQEQIIHQAANLLRESLDVDYTIFLDVLDNFAISSADEESEKTKYLKQSFSMCNGAITPPDELKDEIFGEQPRQPLDQDHSLQNFQRTGTAAKVVGFSSPRTSSVDNIDPDLQFKSPNCKQLRRLLKRYPEGKLWTLNDEGAESSDEEEAVNESVPRANKLSETQFLIQSFPGARQILYAPLFNVEKALHVAACFCVMLEPTPIFTVELEVAFIRAFMNSVSVACHRSSMAAANRLKEDFISSISHELRSPLHGILASVELLSTSALDRLQKEYCGTISTCGQALLETITGILEYTKINTLKKDARGSAKPKQKRPLLLRSGSSEEGVMSRPVSDLLASSNVDIGKACEDSCLLVAAAYMHHISTPDQPLYRVFVPPEAAQQLNGESSLVPAAVTVILDISPGNWKLVALPGALQRIVMNLVGNSLKYTASGFIRVTLNVKSISEAEGQETKAHTGTAMVELNVIDSGRGISSEFLKTKLFSPFEQETILAPGTGLGLHLVKNLVQMHEGSIDIQSEVGKGTHVTVKMRLNQAPTDCDTPESGLQLARDESHSSISEVQRYKEDKSFLLYGFTEGTSEYIKESLNLYLTEWFDMAIAAERSEPAIVITSEETLTDCLTHIMTYMKRPRIIVICDQVRQKVLTANNAYAYLQFELLTIPFGPYKLSKAILACLEPVKQEIIPATINGFHILNPDALSFASGGMLSPPACVESPYSSRGSVAAGDSFPWNAPATQMPVSMHNIRDLPTPLPGATLPIQPAPNSAPFNLLPKNPVETIPEVEVDSNQPRILCVDDNPINLRLLKTFMEKLKFKNITCAENGSLAFEAVRCQKERFDLIFMDLSMPVCDGFQAISLIRTLEKINRDISPPNIPPPEPAMIVALTGLASQRDQDTARDAGADHYITKPMKLSRLKELLVQWNISATGTK